MNHFFDSELLAFRAVFVNGTFNLKECIQVFIPVFLTVIVLFWALK
jgi:hypothetical protein